MELRLNQLAAHLERTLAPVYVIHGDEPLLAIEAGDAIRAAARTAGCDEREVLVAEPGFNWDAFLARQREPGALRRAQARRSAHPVGQARRRRREGARSAAPRSPDPDQHAARHAAEARPRGAGVGVVHGARGRRRRDRRLSARARRAAGVDRGAARAAATARRAGDARVSRRPLRGQPARRAAGDREARPAAARGRDRARGRRARRRPTSRATTSSSCPKRGSPATPRARCASSPRSKPKAKASRCCCGSSARTSMRSRRCSEATAAGTPVAVACATRASGASGRRRWSARRGACRPAAIAPMLRALARLDALSKGIGRGNAWDELRTLALTLAGKPLPLSPAAGTRS